MKGTEVLPELAGTIWTIALKTTPSIASEPGEILISHKPNQLVNGMERTGTQPSWFLIRIL